MIWRLAARSLTIVVVSIAFGLALGLHLLVLLVARRPRERREGVVGAYAARYCELLGGTFVKAGQIVSTRPDIASAPMRKALSKLHDNVGPFSFPKVREAITAELGAPPEELFTELDPYPVAAASISQVHRGRLADGRDVAVKVLRPNIEALVRCDLMLIGALARVVALIPRARTLSPRAAVQMFSEAIWQQLDLRIEAENNRAFAANFRTEPAIEVPDLVPELSGRRVLTMAFVVGSKILEGERDTEQAQALTRAGFRMVLKMVFVDGLIHADLHPGNLLVSEDGKLVLLDVGLVARLSARHRAGLIDVLKGWITRDIELVADGISQVAFYGHQPADPERLGVDIERLLDRYGDRPVGEVNVGDFLADMLRTISQQWARIDPAFAMIGLAIGVIEGVGKELAPDLKLAAEAMPFVAQLGLEQQRQADEARAPN
ncbi:MAG: AarF/ABC1/UbiB kinase family protein [Myxococcales bacterium]|nr:AarF/ABC1/UbiB kinase family protein [Myxococcales bacterium]